MLNKFWAWYEKHYKLNIAVSAFLFSLQLIHLYWLSTDVVLARIFGQSFFPDASELVKFLLILVDYTEVPALVSATILYIHLFRKDRKIKNLIYLVFINIQFIHILWITDEYVVETFTASEGIGWTPILAWTAILIDYLELPVIFETIKQTVKNYLPKFKARGESKL